MKEAILAIIRHTLTTAGGAVTSTGIITGSDWDAAAGALVVLAGVVWSIVEKRLAKKKLDAATQA